MDRDSKTCPRCGLRKALEDFHRKTAAADGRNTYCKVCAATWTRKHAKKPPADKKRARHEVERALAAGRLTKPTACSQCREAPEPKELHAVHLGFEEPLAVTWLCRACSATARSKARTFVCAQCATPVHRTPWAAPHEPTRLEGRGSGQLAAQVFCSQACWQQARTTLRDARSAAKEAKKVAKKKKKR